MGAATGSGEANVSGDETPVIGSALFGLGLAVMKDGSPGAGAAGASGLASRGGWGSR
jgi:hypothetical protein